MRSIFLPIKLTGLVAGLAIFAAVVASAQVAQGGRNPTPVTRAATCEEPAATKPAAPEPAPASPADNEQDILRQDDVLRSKWVELFDKILTMKDGPEKDAADAELERIAAARRALFGEKPPAQQKVAAAGVAGPVARLSGLPGSTVAFSQDGKRILVAGGFNARVWDAQSFKPITGELASEQAISLAQFIGDGKRVVTAGGRRVDVWDASTGAHLAVMKHDTDVLCVAGSPDGTLLATGGEDRVARIWTTATGRPTGVVTAAHQGPVQFVHFTPTGDRLITSDFFVEDHDQVHLPPARLSIRIWDVKTGKPALPAIESKGGWLEGVCLSDDGRQIVANEYWQFAIYDAATAKRLATVKDQEEGHIGQIILSHDARQAAVVGWGYVRVWNIATNKPSGPSIGKQSQDVVRTVKFSPDGKRLLIAAESMKIDLDSQMTGVWDIASGRKVLSIPANDAPTGDFSPDGQRVVIGIRAGAASEAQVWDVPKNMVLADEPPGKTIPATLPAPKDPAWFDVFGDFAESKLPKDVPLPAKTPYDSVPAQRSDYHDGYRLGFVIGVLGAQRQEGVEADRSPQFVRGLKEGQTRGNILNTLREKAARLRDYPFRSPGIHEVTSNSPAEERQVLENFKAFAAKFEKSFRAQLPNTLEMKVVGVLRVYSYEYDDYSADNSGVPNKKLLYKGVFDSDPGGNFEWMHLTIKDPAHPTAEDLDLQSQCGIYFDADQPVKRWSLHVNASEPDGTFCMWQQVGKLPEWNGHFSKAARRMIDRATADAQK
ncbi:MAG TPA: hypothetical protein VFE47_15290 [Tepidisphaeraceae bacterium]|jgi:WD40 repeat protein|nr:hypothetical protein [Tepidisphaeraceae bacterium]